MNTKNIEALQQKIQTIAQQKNTDICLACQLALKLTSAGFASVKPWFEAWVAQLPQLSYETQVALSEVWHCHASVDDFFDPDDLSLILAVRLKWWQTWLAVAPEQAMQGKDKHLLAKALHTLQPRSKASHETLLKVLMAEDKPWSTTLIYLLRLGIGQALLSYEMLCEAILYLLKHADHWQLQAVYGLLKDFYFCFEQCPEVACRKLMNRGPKFEVLGLKILALWRAHPLFDEVIKEPQWSIDTKLVALEVLSAQATPHLADTLVQWLRVYTAHSEALLEHLLAMAYDGVFCHEAQMTSLLHFYFAYDILSARQLAILLHGRFEQKLAGYAAHHPVTPKKWIALLAALKSDPAKKMLHELLQDNRYPNHFEQLVRALVELDYHPAEDTLLAYVSVHPTACLSALQRLGGAKTVAYLKQVLQMEGEKKRLPSFEAQALPLLLQLADNPAPIYEYLQAHQLPGRFELLPYLCEPLHPSAQPFLLSALDQPVVDTQTEALRQLAQQGNAEVLPLVIKKLGNTNEDIQMAAWQCAQVLAQRIARRTPPGSKEANQLLAESILARLPQVQASAVLQRYLGYLTECIDHRFDIGLLEGIAASKDPHVLKFYIACLGASHQPKAFYLIRRFLHPNQDIFTLRQALIALTQMPEGNHEKEVIALLRHRNMNIKKTAVAYLKTHGTQQCVWPLTQLLMNNDNSGLRSTIISVLQGILGANMPFVLLHELSIANSPIKQRFLSYTLADLCPPEQLVQFATNYPLFDLPSDLKQEHDIENARQLEQWVKQWYESQASLRQLLSEVTDLRKAIDNEPALLNALPATRELMGNYLRSLTTKPHDLATWCTLMYQHELTLTDEEARLLYANASGGAKSWGWEVLSLNETQETLEWHNLLHYKNPPELIFLLRYFIPRKGLKAVLDHWLNAGRNVATIRKLLDASGMVSKHLTAVLLELYEAPAVKNQTTKSQAKQEQQVALADWLLSVVGKSAYWVQQMLFKRASLGQQVHLWGLMEAAEQSLLVEEALNLYKKCSVEEQDTLLGRLKKVAQHPALIQLSFEEYLQGKPLTFWQHQPLDPTQIQQLTCHPNALKYLQQRSDFSPFGNDLLRQLLQSTQVANETIKEDTHWALQRNFALLSAERQWQILQPLLDEGAWHWLNWIKEVAPIAPDLLDMLKRANTEGCIYILTWLQSLPGTLFCPGLSSVLLELCTQLPHPLPAVQVLCRLPALPSLANDFAGVFAGYDVHLKTEVLTWLLAQLERQGSPPKAMIKALRQHCMESMHEILLWQIDIQHTDYEVVDEVENALQSLKKLAKTAVTEAVQCLQYMATQMARFSPRQQLHWLAELYAYPVVAPTVTQLITQVFAQELLALTFLPAQAKADFEKRFCEAVKTQQFADGQIVRKALKNFSEDSPPVVNELMEYIVFHEKYRDLKVLCLRLLKKTLPQADYLELCFKLLHTDHLDLLKTAVRTLTFAHYTQAIPHFIKLLFHKDKSIGQAAQNALLHQREAAIEQLEIELPRQRPDRRKVLERVLALF
ncbi:HEAT repeat domain-containing protein [Microscilla marina]|uniref:Uncharacterized protein n=1 Tax=Microscilla marina ATCC 23134 TaxID=313606 RepID=A1ZD15_MICM2|nr:hypothetical protein [Microscilla marina]EAY31554.1 hypothetical protein M23134_05060 [Microscilla marina ATCC 23134]